MAKTNLLRVVVLVVEMVLELVSRYQLKALHTNAAVGTF
jgi:hypothetical protein